MSKFSLLLIFTACTAEVAPPSAETPDEAPRLASTSDDLEADAEVAAAALDDQVSLAPCRSGTYRWVRQGCCTSRAWREQLQRCTNGVWVNDTYHSPNHYCHPVSVCGQ